MTVTAAENFQRSLGQALVFCGLMLAAFAAKLLNPDSENVRYWTPGPKIGVIAAALVALLGILAFSTGVLKPRGWWIPGALFGLWLACFTWLGWFSPSSYFRLHELVRVDLDDPGAVRRAITLHYIKATAIYLLIVALSLVPVLLRSQNRQTRGSP